MLLNRYQTLVFLGDSNSDCKNLKEIVGQIQPHLCNIYLEGRYCDGTMWVEHLCQFSSDSLQQSINLACGCATIDNELVAGTLPIPPDGKQRREVPSVMDQIDELREMVGTLIPQDLVFIQVGSNDLNSLMNMAGSNYMVRQDFGIQELVDRLVRAIDRLQTELGARNIMVLNVRAREDYPAFVSLNDPKLRESVRQTTAQFNSALEDAVAQYLDSRKKDQCKITIFDTYRFQKQLANDPISYGLNPDIYVPRYTPQTNTILESDTKLFVDNYHLAKRPQALLAAEVLKRIAKTLVVG